MNATSLHLFGIQAALRSKSTWCASRSGKEEAEQNGWASLRADPTRTSYRYTARRG